MKKTAILALGILLAVQALAQSNDITAGEFTPQSFTEQGNTLHYQVLYPNGFDQNKKYPLLLFLHGAGERGDDNQKQLTHGSDLFLQQQNDYPAIVLFPQCPKEDYWGDVEVDRSGERLKFDFQNDDTPTQSLGLVMSLVDEYLGASYIDPERLYVMGLSMGGMGTWELLWRMPEKIAAAAPICGGGLPEKTDKMVEVPIWAFHGMDDAVVPAHFTIRLVESVQENGGTAKVSLYPGVNHNSWDNAFAEPKLLPWLFSKSREGRAMTSGSQRVDELMAKMTLEEKIGQLNLLTPGGAVTGEVVSKNVGEKIRAGQVGGIFGIRGADKMREVQEMAVKESRLGIPLITGMDVIHGHQTVLPIPLALSTSWDMNLMEQCAQMAAREATADGIMWNFSPMVDISRDPRWGRIAESAGEDPFLGSRIAEAMVRGYQGDDLSDPLTMMSCVKHLAAYGAAEGGRDYATVDMSHVRLFNEYLPPYKAAVDAGVGSVMTSFNVIDYLPASANDHLFNKILRKQWGFDGFVVTDYTSINEMVNHGVGDLQQVSALALKAGIDMDMVGEGFLTTLKKSLEEGKISERDINQACQRVLLAKEQLGLLDDPYRYFDEERAAREILSESNRTFARQVATQSQVLLKNEDDLLPLAKKGRIAVIGPLADSRRNMMGTWSVSGDHSKSVTVLEGIRNVVGDQATISYTKGANISDDPEFARKVNAFGEEIKIDDRSPDAMLREAVQIARRSDVIIAVVGEAADMTGEASSMADISLQPAQKRLLEALKATGKPIVLVLFNGRPMTLTWEAENMDAILDVWFGGIEAGNAVADVLFGDADPSGKLTTSFPVSVGQIPVYHSMLNTGRPYNGEEASKFKSNYLDIPNEPLYPFGYGLTYTTFEYSDFLLSTDELQKDGTLIAKVTVKNTGKRAGSEIVQLYIRDVVGSISRPMKELKGFEKISLEPGASQTVTFTIDEELLKFYDYDLNYVAESGLFQVFVGPNSRDTEMKEFRLVE